MNILHIITSPRKGDSQSLELGNAIVAEIRTAYTGSKTIERNISDEPLPHLGQIHLTSFFTPAEQRTPELIQAAYFSEQAIEELRNSDTIVIDVPMYNFGIPSTLKSWIDHIIRQGITFSYEKGYPEGLLKNKKVYLAISSGGVYSEGPAKDFDFTESYLRTALGFIGLTDVSVFRAEGIAMPELKDTAMASAMQKVAEFEF